MILRYLNESSDPEIPRDWEIVNSSVNDESYTEFFEFYNEDEDVTVTTTFYQNDKYVIVKVYSDYRDNSNNFMFDDSYDTNEPDYGLILLAVTHSLNDTRKNLSSQGIGSVFSSIDDYSSVKSNLRDAMKKSMRKQHIR